MPQSTVCTMRSQLQFDRHATLLRIAVVTQSLFSHERQEQMSNFVRNPNLVSHSLTVIAGDLSSTTRH